MSNDEEVLVVNGIIVLSTHHPLSSQDFIELQVLSVQEPVIHFCHVAAHLGHVTIQVPAYIIKI
jgi:hypothetical protein